MATAAPSRVFDFLFWALEHYPRPNFLNAKVGGVWVNYSTHDFLTKANRLSLGLLRLGIRKGDKVALISYNRPEWNIVDFALQQIGAISVPLYPSLSEAEARYILEDSESRLVFASLPELYDKVKAASQGLTRIEHIYTFERVPGASHWSDVLEAGKHSSETELEAYREAVQPTDLLTLIYTSGTTGTPKGVMLTHANLVSNVTDSLPRMPVHEQHVALSFLPICHSYERMLIYLYIRCGVGVYYAESLETISENIKEVRPHMFTAVPRLLEKVYDRILSKGYELKGIKRALFFWALRLGEQYEVHINRGWWYNTQLALARKLIFRKWQEALGGRVIIIVLGSAALQPRLARIFWAAGLPVLEGYGLTETSPVVAVNSLVPENHRIGTVGMPIDNVQVKIAADGEILVKGPCVMQGYFKKPEQTAETITPEGWLHTGDIGELVEGRFLKITDRKKEIFKTSGGKYIAPQQIENLLKTSRVIEQALVCGEGQKYPVALLVPAFANLREWCALKGLAYSTDAEMVTHPQVLEKMQRELDTLNQGLGQWEKIKRFALLPQVFSIEAGELTPTLKPKRKVLALKYQSQIEALYREE